MRTLITALAALTAIAAATGSAAQETEDSRPTLKIGVQTLPEGLDPGLNISNVGQRITYSVFDHLIKRAYWETEAGDGANLVPSIATEWRNVSPTVWEVDLRDDVVFHNGDKLTAEDVAFSFSEQRMWGKERMVPEGPQYFGSFTDVKALDEDTVQFTTVAPDPIFAKRFTAPLGNVVPKDYYLEKGVDGFNLEPVGTGPYKVAEIRNHEIVRLVANDDYWGGKPPVKEIQFLEIPEESTRITGLITGELDIIANVSPDQQDVLEKAEHVIVKPALIDNHRIMIFNTLNAPMDNVNLRRALAHGVDREAIVKALWRGYSRVPQQFNLPGHGEFYMPERGNIEYDPEKAKEFLEASDYDGEEIIFRITEGYYTGYLDAAQIMQQMWRDLGINVKIEVRDSWAIVREGGYHLLNWSNGMQVNDITHPIATAYGRMSGRVNPEHANFFWQPPDRFFELHDLMSTTMGPEERRAQFIEALDIVDAELPQLPIFQNVEFYAVRDTIEWRPYSFFPMDLSARNLAVKE